MKIIQRVWAVALSQGNQPGDGTEFPTGTRSSEEPLKKCSGKTQGLWMGGGMTERTDSLPREEEMCLSEELKVQVWFQVTCQETANTGSTEPQQEFSKHCKSE